jgi:predicted dehydrogenase
MNKRDQSRRKFISRSLLGTGSIMILPRFVLGGPGHTPPSEKLNIAGIGIGGVGKRFLNDASTENIMALCDVDEKFAYPVFKKYPMAKRYRDYREMLDKEKDIDGVIIATPDHTHAVIAMEVIRKKKHILCVKPLTRTIHESQILAKAARKAKIATNVTASSRVSEGACRLVEMIRDHAIGDVKEVHCWSNRPIWPQGMVRPEGKDDIPENLDWDLWIGPAPMRPFKQYWPEGHLAVSQMGWKKKKRRRNVGIYHPFTFRGWWDFGTGALGDMGVHHFNTLFLALNLGYPASIEASSTRLMPETAPLSSVVTFEFPARKGMGPVKLVWYDGGLKPPRPRELESSRTLGDMGNIYIGTKGTILGSLNSGRIIPEEKMKKYKLPPERLKPRDSCVSEWFDACRGGEDPSCNFDVAGLITEVVLMGNIAIRTGKKLYWDSSKRRFKNSEEANEYLHYEYRSGWSL